MSGASNDSQVPGDDGVRFYKQSATYLFSLGSIVVIASTIVFICSMFQFFHVRSNTKHTSLKRRSKAESLKLLNIAQIAGYSFSSMLACGSTIAMTSYAVIGIPLATDSLLCTQVLPRFASFFYVWGHYILYEFWYSRALLVDFHQSELRIPRRLAWLGTKAIGYGFSFATAAMWTNRVEYHDGLAYCVQNIVWQYNIALAIIDPCFNMIYLWLFLYPLIMHMRKSNQEMTETEQIKHVKLSGVIWRNFEWTAFGVMFTLIGMVAMGVISHRYYARGDLVNIAVSFADLDMFCNLIAITQMTNSWIPQRIVDMMSSLNTSRIQSASDERPTGQSKQHGPVSPLAAGTSGSNFTAGASSRNIARQPSGGARSELVVSSTGAAVITPGESLS